MSAFAVLRFSGALISTAGFVVLYFATDWIVMSAVFLCIWGHTLEQHVRRPAAD